MFACIPLLLIALFMYMIHSIGNKQAKKYREMELTKGEGIIDHFGDDNGYTKYYIRFNANGETVVKKAVGTHGCKSGYNRGVRVPIGYHVDEKGIVTVFIDDEHLKENKNHAQNNMFLYGALIMVGITIIYAIKTLLES